MQEQTLQIIYYYTSYLILTSFLSLTEIFLGSETDCFGTEWKRCLPVKFNFTCSCTQSGKLSA